MKRKIKIFNIIKLIIIIILLVIIIISSYKIIIWHVNNMKTKKVDTHVKEIAKKEIVRDDKDNEILKVDLKRLVKENEETVGWINIPGIEVDYPIVQHSDNSYYLNHSFDKSYNSAGWIFMDYRNDSSLNNKNTIVYGHNMLNDTMFGSLSKLLKDSYINNYKGKYYIYLSNLDGNYVYEIFSVYHIEPTDDYIRTEFVDDDDYSSWLTFIKDRSMGNYNVSVSKDDKILTLSSCYSLSDRFAVHAKLINNN